MIDTFPISPASAKTLWFVSIVCLIVGLVFIFLVYTAYAARHSSVEVTRGHIRLVGDFWGRKIAINSLRVAEAKTVNLTRSPDYHPKRRTLGTGLPGYASGWFKLANGEKALVYLTRRDRVAYIPTSSGYSLLLSVDEPDQFIRMLSRLAHQKSAG